MNDIVEQALDEVLNIAQRQKRAQIVRANKKKLEIARRVAKKKMAPAAIIKKRAYAQARKIIRRKFAGKRGADYANLGVSEKIVIDKAISKKHKLIKKLALRLIPRIQQAEAKRLQSFMKGAQLTNLGKNESVNEEAEVEDTELNDKFTKNIGKKKKEKDEKKEDNGGKPPIKFFRKFSEETDAEDPTFKALSKKSEKSGIDLDILGEVYNRGAAAWKESYKYSQEQYAFARVNSYINQGKTYFKEDADLHDIEEGYAIGDKVNVTNPKATAKYKIIGKTKTHYHIEKPNGDKMHMPKERIARVNKQAWALRKAKVNEDKDPCWDSHKQVGMKEKNGKKVPNCVPMAKEEIEGVGQNENAVITELDKQTIKNYLLKRGTNAKKPTYNTGYHAKIKKDYGDDDPEVQSYDKMAAKHKTRVKSIERAEKQVPNMDHTKELNKKLDGDADFVKQYGGSDKYHQTPEGGGYVVGKADKADHAKMRINTSTGSRSGNNNDYVEKIVHVKHLKEAWTNFDKWGKAIINPKSPCGKGYSQAGVKVVDGKEVPICVKNGTIKEESEIDESNNTPYVKPHHGDERNPTLQTGWKSSNKHGKVKYFGKEFKPAADKHSGVNEETELSEMTAGTKIHLGFGSKGGAGFTGHVVKTEGEHVHIKTGNGRVLKGPIRFATKLSKHAMSESEIDPAKREVGTDSATASYKADTPGQGEHHKDCNTPECCGKCSMKEGTIEGVPVVHTNAADTKRVKVTTADGKVVWRNQKQSRDLIK